MISSANNVEDLIAALVGDSLPDVLARITAEKRAAEASAKLSPEPVRGRMFDYTQSCRCLQFWLTRTNQPRNGAAFPLFRSLTAVLVQQGSLPPAMMAAFK